MKPMSDPKIIKRSSISSCKSCNITMQAFNPGSGRYKIKLAKDGPALPAPVK
jgi:hypothetical protein